MSELQDWKLKAQAVVKMCSRKCDKSVSLLVLRICRSTPHNFPVDFVRFCRPQKRTAVYRPRGLPQCTWVCRLLPQSAPKMAAKAPKNHLSACFNTNHVFAATFPCILFCLFVVDRSVVRYTSVYCRIQAYQFISMTKLMFNKLFSLKLTLRVKTAYII